MSNNIYDILKKMQSLAVPKQSLNESKKSKPDYLDMDKDGDKKEPMKKAVKDKEKGAIAEAVARVESTLMEKYQGYKKSTDKLGEDYGMPKDLALAQMRAKEKKKDDSPIDQGMKKANDAIGNVVTKYVQPAFEPVRKAVVKGAEELVSVFPAGKAEVERNRAEREAMAAKKSSSPVDESGLQAYLGKKKYGKEGMKALQKAGRDGASKEKMAKIRAKHDKMDESETNEDMLSPNQKKFAALAEPKNKITYADKIAGAKKKQKDEGNEFSGELAKARAQGKDSFEVDGKEYPVKENQKSMREGWEEMQKYLDKKRGPESKGGAGKKAGTRYGGSAQRDDAEEMDSEGQPVVKKKGRPKGTGGGAKFSFKKPKD